MAMNAPHQCEHMSCKCNVDTADEFCGIFCKDVETSEDDMKCGCGHMRCDATKEMGNENTFSRSGS